MNTEDMSEHITDIEGDWKIVRYKKHPECMNYTIIIKGHGFDSNVFKIHVRVVNEFTCILKHNPETNKWEISEVTSTELIGRSKEHSHTEDVLHRLIISIENVVVHEEHQLIFSTNKGERIELERLP